MGRPMQSSFASGELSPALHSRVDYERYYNGLALARNFTVIKEGGIQSRAGFEFVVQCLAGNAVTRLIEFQFSVDQTYILMFSDQKVRFIRNGGAILNSTVAVTGATGSFPATVTTGAAHGYSNDDIVFITGTGASGLDSQFFKISSVTATTFQVSGDSAGAGAGSVASIYEVSTPYVEADLFDLKYTQSADVMTFTHPGYAVRDLSRITDTNWTLTTKTIGSTATAPGALTITQVGTASGANNKTYRYVVTTVDTDGNESVASPIGTSGSINALAETYGNKITWAAVTGADFYRVYKENFLNSGIFGYLGEADGLEFQDYNWLADLSLAPPESNAVFNGADDYPSCVEYYQQRLMFGRTNNKVQTVWGSQTGNYENFDYSRPARAADSVEFELAARTINDIKHLVSLEYLLIFTSGSIWKVGAGGSGVLTPYTIDARRQGTRGSSDLNPLVIGDTVLFVQEKGARVRDLNYVFDSDSYTGNDLSVFSEHLLDGLTIVDWCYSEEPFSVVWMARSDGVLLSLTYLREQNVYGWCQHDVGGEVESVASVSEGDSDAVYIVVKRNINGSDVRYVERLHDRRFDDIKDAFCVDSGLTYSGAATDTIYGLGHLEGETVTCLGDGNVFEGLTVTNGSITLPEDVELAHIGLPYVCDAQTLPINYAKSQIQSLKKSINRIVLRVLKTRGLKTGSRADKLYETKERDVTMGYADITTRTGEQFFQVDPDWSSYGDIFIRQDKPLPATILAVIPETKV